MRSDYSIRDSISRVIRPFRALQNVPLQCSCNVWRVREWARARHVRLIEAVCDTNKSVASLSTDQFGNGLCDQEVPATPTPGK